MLFLPTSDKDTRGREAPAPAAQHSSPSEPSSSTRHVLCGVVCNPQV